MAAIDVGEADFQREVLGRSEEVPVVVDFWAPWCAPCRSFGPVLEAGAAAHSGSVVLVKVDVEANPSLAAHYKVHGIPAVKAFRGREVAVQFVGARSPAFVRRFLGGLGHGEIDDLIGRGDEASLRRAVELDRRRSDAAVALARLLHGAGETMAALDVLKPVRGGFRADGFAARIRLDRVVDEDLSRGFEALDAGEAERAFALLGSAATRVSGEYRADIEQIVRSARECLGFGHPLVA